MTSSKEWIEKKIKGDDITQFEYSEFSNFVEIGKGGFGFVRRADIRGTQVALKCLMTKKDEIDDLVNECKILRKVHYHSNINKFLGITKDSDGYYIMILEYANGGSLRDYLGNDERFKSFGWKDKIRMSLDITCGLMCLHKENIVHRDLHSKNILVNNGILLIADFGISKHLEEMTSNSIANVFGMPEYIDPQCYRDSKFKKDKKSDIYSLGVLLWEITSGRPPFPNYENKFALIYHLLSKNREKPIEHTPPKYQNIYQDCWDDVPNKRPDIEEVYGSLKQLELEFDTNEAEPTSQSSNSSTDTYVTSMENVNFLLIEKKSDSPNNTTKFKKNISATQSSNSLTATYVNSVTLINLPIGKLNDSSNPSTKSKKKLEVIIQSYLKYNKTGWTKNYNFINVLKRYESESKEIFNYLINNPTIQHYEIMVGKFYQEGFGTDKNQQKGLKWFLNACKNEDEHGKYEVGACYFHSLGIEKSMLKAKQYFESIVDCGPNIALYKLANCYEFTISLEKEVLISKAFQLYKTSAEKGFIPSQFKVAYHYSHGFYTQINEGEALKWYKSFHKNGGYPDYNVF
ncbi:133_t:CDS:2 [Funneliformis geosporum]|nr:133_t:CDS:2 [Funneliformis geosporum]